ncbi:alkaline phosphatase D family protein [Cryobacterium sp. PH29-G1]|uniref:alkaline phosphatase D family protein n=1 Tax=Cryobacterium sp. PH29-G1 TaxID=3046211 RepID=UPI0024B94AAC|nr:alkaline phosphatase D family protein [Cryobacterium sp. PH29-G1]MDJ0348169.1 alkaline phosphatase D family protein [Cryobacterium sp. PH29-G1]
MTNSALILGPMVRYVDDVSASIWCETREAGQVTVLVDGRSWRARTFAVHGHHYALVSVDGLQPDTTLPYAVLFHAGFDAGFSAEFDAESNGERAWPAAHSTFPACVIATLGNAHPLRLSFGSCRTSVPHDAEGNRTHGVDALRAYALRLASPENEVPRPDLILFLGDQVYADLTTKKMQEFIRARRDITEPPGKELADFEEYAHLYRLAWSDEANRWLFSTVSTAMIFDDHDIRDDWNTSLSWKRKMAATSWWRGRITAGLASYWVYQHLGNMSPAERADDEIWQEIAAHDGAFELDISSRLDAFAKRCDREPASYRWSYCRDFNDVRLIVVDSRAARELEPTRRALLDTAETDWLDQRMRGGFRQLLIGTSLPFLLPPGLHHLESWDEAVSEGAWGKSAARVAERVRRLVDLEHWAAFQRSFLDLARMAAEVADGKRGSSPQTVTFLSGDVHYSTVSEVERTSGSRIVQAVCSPIRNPLPVAMRSFSAVLSYGIATRLGAMLARSAGVAPPPFRWAGIRGPWFDNCLASLEDTPAGLKLWWEKGVVHQDDHLHPVVEQVATLTLAPRSS